ncbi:cell division ATP-binding protein FtsE [Anthocerotibacter panamensis]|uniref:cell division ATP-binding protein FtsE n=1 Tax=Anthocerotibacter panamensis TaxID=2857077 RepID=UPI001C406CE4|nr:cell division ATP-binding protein FtsE [Anthocerotibacter panamensis]
MCSLLPKSTPAPLDPDAPLIRLEQVHKVYPNGAIGLDGFSLSVTQGDFLWVSGVSGSGKSTFLKLLYGAERPTSGEVWVNRQPVAHLNAHRLAALRRCMGVVFQDYKLLPRRTVCENITFVLRALGYTRHDIHRRLLSTLKIVGLEHKADCFPEQLSGGEQQRVAIARAIVHTPVLLLADESTGNLDPANTQIVLEILDELHKAGVTIVVTTHDQTLLSQTGHPIVTLDKGRLVEQP